MVVLRRNSGGRAGTVQVMAEESNARRTVRTVPAVNVSQPFIRLFFSLSTGHQSHVILFGIAGGSVS
jgi:hypothetical protein